MFNPGKCLLAQAFRESLSGPGARMLRPMVPTPPGLRIQAGLFSAASLPPLLRDETGVKDSCGWLPSELCRRVGWFSEGPGIPVEKSELCRGVDNADRMLFFRRGGK